KFQGAAGYEPKPRDVKAKIDPLQGWSVEGGVKYISDYDLMGIYFHRGSGCYDRLYVDNYLEGKAGRQDGNDLKNNRFLREINAFVCPEWKPMFIHGPNDDWLDSGRPTSIGEGYGSDSAKAQNFLVVKHDSQELLLLPTGADLERFYLFNRIAWKYKHHPGASDVLRVRGRG
ncbi:MAG: hypothetical protein N2C14_23665, partial [Planctomycetales bacterium]